MISAAKSQVVGSYCFVKLMLKVCSKSFIQYLAEVATPNKGRISA